MLFAARFATSHAFEDDSSCSPIDIFVFVSRQMVANHLAVFIFYNFKKARFSQYVLAYFKLRPFVFQA